MKLSKYLVEEVQRFIEESGEFRNVEEFIEFVLTEILREDEDEDVYSSEDEEEIRKRLRALGYIE